MPVDTEAEDVFRERSRMAISLILGKLKKIPWAAQLIRIKSLKPAKGMNWKSWEPSRAWKQICLLVCKIVRYKDYFICSTRSAVWLRIWIENKLLTTYVLLIVQCSRFLTLRILEIYVKIYNSSKVKSIQLVGDIHNL